MQTQRNRQISGHIRLREGKRGSTWYAKYRGPVRLQDGSVVIKQTETKIGRAWTGSGRPAEGCFTHRGAQVWLEAKLTDLRRGVGIPPAAPAPRSGCRRGVVPARVPRAGVEACHPPRLPVRPERPPRGRARPDRWGGRGLSRAVRRLPLDRSRRKRSSDGEHERWPRDACGTRRTAVKVVAILHGIFARARKPPFNLTSNPADDVGRSAPATTPDGSTSTPWRR